MRVRMTNIAGNPAIRVTNRTASRGRRVPAEATRAGDGAMTMVRGAMIAAAVAGAGCTRVPAEPVGVVRAVSANGR